MSSKLIVSDGGQVQINVVAIAFNLVGLDISKFTVIVQNEWNLFMCNMQLCVVHNSITMDDRR